MTGALRLAFVVLGLALAVYGTSTLTGGWLGTPPWWEREMTHAETEAAITEAYAQLKKGYDESNADYLRWSRSPLGSHFPPFPRESPPEKRSASPAAVQRWLPFMPIVGREWISGAVIAVGVGLIALAAWPRRREVAA